MAETKKIIRLTQGLFAEVDTIDLIWLSQYKWYAKRNTSQKEDGGRYYAARFVRTDGIGRTIYMHREIMGCPDGKVVDHVNENSMCNKRKNLEVMSRSEHNNKYNN